MKKFLALAFVALMTVNNAIVAADESRLTKASACLKGLYTSVVQSVTDICPKIVSDNPKKSAAVGVAAVVGCYYLYKTMCANCTWFARVTGKKVEKSPEMKHSRK